MSSPYGRRTSRTGCGPSPAGTHASVASRTPSRIGTMMSFSTLKLIGSPRSRLPPLSSCPGRALAMPARLHPGQLAAVDDQAGAVHERGVVGGQERVRGGHLLG